tara:strand:+ start:561 stop:809 length:249 start_codon:yes stop_codon:yes gene_type:complete
MENYYFTNVYSLFIDNTQNGESASLFDLVSTDDTLQQPSNEEATSEPAQTMNLQAGVQETSVTTTPTPTTPSMGSTASTGGY